MITYVHAQKTRRTTSSRPTVKRPAIKPVLDIEARCSEEGVHQTFSMAQRRSVFSGEIIRYSDQQFRVLEISLGSEKWVAKQPTRQEDIDVILALAKLQPKDILYRMYAIEMVFPKSLFAETHKVEGGYVIPTGPEAMADSVSAVLQRFIPENRVVLRKVGCAPDPVVSK